MEGRPAPVQVDCHTPVREIFAPIPTEERKRAFPAECYPKPGSWVTFKLNTAVWEPFCTTALGLPTHRLNILRRYDKSFQYYVGLVAGAYDAKTESGESCIEAVVLFLTAPENHEHEFSDTVTKSLYEMSVPVGWEPGPHMRGRSALRTNLWMPWKSATQMTTAGTRLRVTNFHKSKLEFSMKDSEFSRFEDMLEDDLNLLQIFIEMYDFPRRTDLDVPPQALPADLWSDIRVCDYAVPPDPREFVDEVRDLANLLLE